MLMKNNNLIAISGKMGAGKDLVGQIINICVTMPHLSLNGIKSFIDRDIDGDFQIKKFADKLKEIVCILINCTREQLEDREFKEKELGEEWWYVKKWYPANPEHKKVFTLIPYVNFDSRILDGDNCCAWEVISTTPRILLQLLGTDAGRDIIHPNIWCNALFAEYKTKKIDIPFGSGTRTEKFEPKWIITDLRFPNELEAIQQRNGVTIRVNREIKHQVEVLGGRTNVPEGYFPTNQHSSETTLDNFKLDYVINNNSTIDTLINNVRDILIKEKLI